MGGSSVASRRERKRVYMQGYRKSPKNRAYVKDYQKRPETRLKRSQWRKATDRRYKKSDAYRASRNRYRRNRLKRDINFRLAYYLSNQLRSAVAKQHRHSRIITLLGCSIESFKIYLGSRFQVGMTWENYGNREGCWTIDHIVPVSLFDLTNPEHQRYCFHFSNMQPMWHVENLTKSNHITEGRQMNLPMSGL